MNNETAKKHEVSSAADVLWPQYSAKLSGGPEESKKQKHSCCGMVDTFKLVPFLLYLS